MSDASDASDALYTELVERFGERSIGGSRALEGKCVRCVSASVRQVALRPYQADLVDQLRDSYRKGFHALLLQLATGGGKTIVFTAITASAHERGKHVLIVAHRKELIQQASMKLTAAGVPHGIIAPGHPETADSVQVGSIQTIVRRLDRLPAFDLIVLDEAHHAVAAQWTALLKAQPQARRLGVTATPVRLDGKGLGIQSGGIFDVLVEGPSIAKLTDGGFLAPARYFVPERKIDTSAVPQVGGDFTAAGLEKLLTGNTRITGDAIDSYRRHADHQPAICFVASVRHGDIVAAQFQKAGYQAACVHGALPAAKRDAMIAALGTGEIEILMSCELISEGLDVPAVGAVILLRPTASLGLHLQQIGRGLRPAPGKLHLIVLDHVGNVLEHGRADDAREWTLDAGLTHDTDKRKAPVKRCDACGAANAVAARMCENCGIAFPAEEPDFDPAPGRLVELTRERIDYLAHQPHHRLRGMVLSEAEVRAIGRERGYKRGWAAHYLREQAVRLGGAA
jgi:DNA repair protein RadD